MRKQLNENPAVQAGLILVLAIVFAFILFTRVLGGSEPPPQDAAAPSAAGATAPGAGVATPAPAGADVAPDTAAASPAPSGGLGFEAGPGLPKPLVEAYDSGKTVVLLAIREHPQGCYSRDLVAGPNCAGIDDSRVNAIVRALRFRPATEVFVTHAFGLARYSRIAQGVDVDRVPALIVLRPKRLSNGSLPVASINYGFRGPASVLQSVRDAEYKGPANLPSHP